MSSTQQRLFIRQARRKDRQEMKACNERNLAENYSLQHWETTLNDHPGCSYVLTDPENKVHGYLLSNEATVLSFAVDEQYRQKRWGTKLFEEFLKHHAHKHNVTLHVRMSNQVAQRMYAKYGFIVVDELEKYYHNPEENGYLMQRPKE